MARELQAKLEDDADRKGLSGEERQRYIGGAWNRIKGREARSRWRYSDDAQRLARFYGPIHDLRELRGRPGEIAFRQGATWYHLPREEYHALNLAALEAERHEGLSTRQREREEARETRDTERQLRTLRADRRAADQAERERATLRAQEERTAQRSERAEAAERDAQRRQARLFERTQYSDVLAIIRQGGGIRPSVTQQGAEYEGSEYRALPSHVRRRSGRLTMDDAARNINAQMPWLGIETPSDLQEFFSRQTERRYRLAS